MTNFEFSNFLMSIVENFPDIIEQSEKIRQAIDYRFESTTKSFFHKIIAIFSTFAIPYLVHLFAGLGTTANQMLLTISLLGWCSLYSLELVALGIEGLESYLSDPWNYLD
jgi:hypothetical protein